jgi:hypothetical protein
MKFFRLSAQSAERDAATVHVPFTLAEGCGVKPGWYWHLTGTDPISISEAIGPFDTEQEAIEDANRSAFLTSEC